MQLGKSEVEFKNLMMLISWLVSKDTRTQAFLVSVGRHTLQLQDRHQVLQICLQAFKMCPRGCEPLDMSCLSEAFKWLELGKDYVMEQLDNVIDDVTALVA